MECPHTLGPLKRPPIDMATRGPTEAHGQTDRYKDPNEPLIGKHVRVIKKHRLKDYEGIVKATLEKDMALVEIQATMKKEVIPIIMLGLMCDNCLIY